METYTKGVAGVKARCAADGEEPEEEAPYCETFAESNMKHAINGYMYDNNPYFTMKVARSSLSEPSAACFGRQSPPSQHPSHHPSKSALTPQQVAV